LDLTVSHASANMYGYDKFKKETINLVF